MSDTNDSTIIDSLNTAAVVRIPRPIRFWYFLCFNILSLACTLFNIYVILSERTLRRALHNHILIILLFICLIAETTHIPWFIRNDQYDTPWKAPPTFYLFWGFLEYFLYSLQIGLYAWATVARHIFIFHESWLQSARRRFLIHYLPMIVIILYSFSYHAMVYFGVPCDTTFDAFLNGGLYAPCAFTRTSLGTWDLIGHQLVPTLIILFSSVALLIRVIYQKNRLRRTIHWRKHRKMTIQLLLISSMYLTFNIPWVVIILAFQFGLPASIATYGMVYAKFLWYNITFLFPFIVCFSVPELRMKAKESFLKWHRQRQTNVVRTITHRTMTN